MSRLLAPLIVELDSLRHPGETKAIIFRKDGVEVGYITVDGAIVSLVGAWWQDQITGDFYRKIVENGQEILDGPYAAIP